MDTPNNLSDDGDEMQLSFFERQAKLSARFAKLVYMIEDFDDAKDEDDDLLPINDILDTRSYLGEVETVPQAKGIMDVLVKHNILKKVKEGNRELYYPAIKEIEKLERCLINDFKKAIARIIEMKN